MITVGAMLVVQKITAVVTAAMMVVTLSAIAVVKADNKKPQEVATGQGAGSSSDVAFGSAGEEDAGAGDAGGGQAAAGGGAAGAAGTGASGPGGNQAAGSTNK